MFVNRVVVLDGTYNFQKKAFLPIVHVSFYNFNVVLVNDVICCFGVVPDCAFIVQPYTRFVFYTSRIPGPQHQAWNLYLLSGEELIKWSKFKGHLKSFHYPTLLILIFLSTGFHQEVQPLII